MQKLLRLLILLPLLAACASVERTPRRSPPPAPSPSPAARAPATATVPFTTATPRTAVVPSAAATLAPTLVPLGTPRQPEVTLATYFFYWYDCPHIRCDPATVPVVPPGWTDPLPEGGFISTENRAWFEREVRQMAEAGIQVVLPVSWGNEFPDESFHTSALQGLVEANARLGSPLRIGLFDDTSSQSAEFGDYLDDGVVNGSSYRVMPSISLARPESGFFFYDRKIKPFFELVPRSQWALVEGRPLLVVYTASCCFDLQHAGPLWRAVKDAFVRDFGVEPWLVLEDTWFQPQASQPPAGDPPIEEVADGRYAWGAAASGRQARRLGEYTTASVGPGFDNGLAPGVPADRHIVRQRRDGQAFARDLAAVPADADLVLLETWNEWYEGSTIAPAPYRATDGDLLPHDHYLQILRRWRYGQ